MKTPPVIEVEILSLGTAERYAVRRMIAAARDELESQYPGLEIRITEIDDSNEIGKVAATLVLPSLVVNGRLVCSGGFPTRESVAAWLRGACELEVPPSKGGRDPQPVGETVKAG